MSEKNVNEFYRVLSDIFSKKYSMEISISIKKDASSVERAASQIDN